MMEIRNTTKMAIQAAIAISIAEFVSIFFQLERGYWTVLTVMTITSQTWGESVKRSLERVSMTVFGGICGTVLYFTLPDSELLVLTLLLIFVFFTVYLIQIYYLIAVFFLTCFVVFLFAMLGEWNLVLLRARIFDTILGAFIALPVSFFFVPAKTNTAELFINHLEKIKVSLNMAFIKNISSSQVIAHQHLYADFQVIRKRALSIRYEVLFHRITRRNFYLLFRQTAFCTHYVIGLVDAYQWLEMYLREEDKKQILQAVSVTEHNLDVMIKFLKNEAHSKMQPAENMKELVRAAVYQEPERFALFESEAWGFFNLMYFFTQLNTHLNDVYSLLNEISEG